jgi:MFS family permease
LLGFLSDRLGRRKPVIFVGAALLLAMLAWVLFGMPAILRGPAVGIIMGVASGAAMLPYTVIKEANPPELGGTATGVINFLNFTFSAFLGPVFGWMLVQASAGSHGMGLEHYQAGFKPLLYGVGLALVLTCFLKETGPAAHHLPFQRPRKNRHTKVCPNNLLALLALGSGLNLLIQAFG